MSPRVRFTLLFIVLALAAGVVIRTDRAVTRQRERLTALTAQAGQLEKQVAAEQRDREATARDLELARRQLAELPPAPEAAERAREADLRAWLARVARLRELFKARPDQVIPEMRLLTDADWLEVARKSAFGVAGEERRALAAVRMAAKTKFNNQLARAVGKYMRTVESGERPVDVATLAPYFDEPPDQATLQRYELTTLNQPNRPRNPNLPPGLTAVNATAAWAVREAAAIDPDYDDRFQVSSTGSIGTMGAPLAWVPNYSERAQAAAKAYAEANPGAGPTSFADFAPYFNPPLDPATVERAVQAERVRNK